MLRFGAQIAKIYNRRKYPLYGYLCFITLVKLFLNNNYSATVSGIYQTGTYM